MASLDRLKCRCVLCRCAECSTRWTRIGQWRDKRNEAGPIGFGMPRTSMCLLPRKAQYAPLNSLRKKKRRTRMGRPSGVMFHSRPCDVSLLGRTSNLPSTTDRVLVQENPGETCSQSDDTRRNRRTVRRNREQIAKQPQSASAFLASTKMPPSFRKRWTRVNQSCRFQANPV